MNKKPDPEMIDDENPEWTEDDFRNSMNFTELQEEMKRRRLVEHPTKVSTTIRLDRDVIAALRATGKGWQTRLNDMIRESLRAQSRL